MAWFRTMGAEEVAYHQATVVGREDDHPGRALGYYGSRGETPLRWGGAGAARLDLSGEVTPEAYEAAFGPGGFRHPVSGERLVAARRPGFELVVSAHKSVAVLGVIERAEEMHSILDVETGATMDWLDSWFQARGGRRGRDQARTATGGLTYAVTRHATSRAGDPSPHDHVLVANVAEMLDERGGHKALDSAALRDTVEAATMVGRLHAAWRAVELGFDIEPDDGPSGNLRHWRITGVPDGVCEEFSKRSDEIAEHLEKTGKRGYRARGIAARASRSAKRHTGVDELLPAWRAELTEMGWPVERLTAHLTASQERRRGLPFPLTAVEIDQLAGEVFDVDGRLLANHKAFTRTNLIAELAPRLYGRDPAELERVLDRMLASRDIVPLIRVAGAREQTYTTAQVLTAEATIARTVEALADHARPAVDTVVVAAAVAAKELAIGHQLTAGQRATVDALCAGRGATVVVGVAGAGKTTALDAATTALEHAGYRVLGTSTSGQAARTLGDEAGIHSRTFASLLWRLDHGQIGLDERTVVIVDEAGMAEDADLARLALAVERTGGSLVLVGDHRQLAAVGPGGALAALLDRRPEIVVTLEDNVRQAEAGERRALAELRNGDVETALDWYADNDRIRVRPRRLDTLASVTEAWAADVAAGADTVMLAWRRADVADLNRFAREKCDDLGHLTSDDVNVTGGRPYAVGERVVALAPNPRAGIITSEQLTITALTEDTIIARTRNGRVVTLTGEGIDREHLDYAYALTVHRAQGATVDRAHVLAAGGGRELAYVALSRARQSTTIHVTADNIEQALDDLATDWGAERHQRWITDTPAQPGREPEPERRVHPRERLAAATTDYHDLLAGTGRWHDTPAGTAARDRTAARAAPADAERRASHGGSRRARRSAAKSVSGLTSAVAAAEARWQEVGQPVADLLRAEQLAAQREVDALRLREELTAALERLDQVQARGVEPDLDLGLGL